MRKPLPTPDAEEYMRTVLELWGKLATESTTARTAAYTLGKETFVPVDTTAGGLTMTLPAVAQSEGRIYIIFKLVAVNTLTISGGGVNINGAASITATDIYACRIIICANALWWVIASTGA